MNKMLVLYGSPHQDGPTGRMTRVFLDHLPPSVVVECYDTFNELPHPCTDCGHCKIQATCKFRDLDGLYRSLENVDTLLIATPIYNSSFPAPLKAVIDRMQLYYNARFFRGMRPPIQKGKKVVLITSSGRDKQAAAISKQLAPVFTVIHCTLFREIHLENTDRSGDISDVIPLLIEAASALD